MTDDQRSKIDPLNPLKEMTGRQVASWLRRGQRVFAKNQMVEAAKAQAVREAAIMAERAQIAEQKRQAQIAAIRMGIGDAAAVQIITPGKVAAFLWLPQLRMSFSGFGFAFALLVQTFAQALITVGLLPPDHPARTATGAKSFGIFQLLEEARLNLLPIRAVLDRNAPAEFAGIRVLATRQYTVFGAAIGVLVTGALSIFFGLARIVFGSAHAFAQSTTSAVTTSGTGIGSCSLSSTSASSTATVDLASSCIDSIFGTGTGTTTSLVGSGLGTMFQLYSNMMLVFAGIIVLWIIVSAVAETARTGVPFGKNFNPVWAPIRLIVALGLLVPLGSGLNSGQYIVISLAKWGSSQGTAVWSAFANKMIAGTSSGSPGSGGTSQSTTSGLSAVVFDDAASKAFAAGMFQIALCQAVNNTTCGGSNNDNCPGEVVQSSPVGITPPTSVSSVSSSGATPVGAASTVDNQISWYASDSSGNKVTGGADCGSVTLTTPPVGGTSTTSQTTGPQAAAQAAVQNLLTQQSAITNTTLTSLQGVANTAVTVAQQMTSQSTPPSGQAFETAYQAAISNYITQQKSNVQSAVNSYNSAVSNNMNASTLGWVYAPVWLTSISEANAMVADAARVLPQVTPPVTPFATTDSTSESLWNNANQLVKLSAAPASSTQSEKSQEMIADLQALTNTTNANPLASAGTYGRQMLLNGFIFIQSNAIDCMTNPQSSACSTAATANAVNSAEGEGHGHTILPIQGNLTNQLSVFTTAANGNPAVKSILYPLGMIMISMGFLLVMLTFIPLMRFLLGILNWILLLFEALLAVPLMALSLLKTDGDGFATQQFQSNLTMLLGVILRPILMSVGLVLGLVAFNMIMGITNMLFAPAASNLTPSSDNSLLTLGIYIMVYTSLAYTLANSAFKAIDLLPNFVMAWIGQRMENRVDDASAIQAQSQSYMQTLSMAGRMNGNSSGTTPAADKNGTGANPPPSSTIGSTGSQISKP